jgi:phosphoribosylformylglycinamidine (FGAM) synthase PurS component
MRTETVIEVAPKKGVTDPVGRGLLSDVRHLGIKGVKAVGSAQLFKLIGRVSAKDKERIARDLLCDPIIQEYKVASASPPAPLLTGEGSSGSPSPVGRGWHRREASVSGEATKGVVIDVWFKSGVTDVVGDSVVKGIRDLSIGGIEEVRTGMRYHFYGLANESTADRIALAYLANPLIQDRVISATTASADSPKG